MTCSGSCVDEVDRATADKTFVMEPIFQKVRNANDAASTEVSGEDRV